MSKISLFGGLFLLLSTITLQVRLHAESPFGNDGDAASNASDPFAQQPLTDRFQWQEFISIQQSVVSGRDVVGAMSPTTITLAAGNVFMINDDTVIVRQSPGRAASPATRGEISVGTPISYEIDISRSPAARRIVVWHGVGPHGHEIYNDRIRALMTPLRNRGMKHQPLTLDHPESPMEIAYASSKQVIPPGKPQLIRLDSPQTSIDVFSGDQKQTISAGKDFSAILAFRSYGSRGTIVFIE